LNLNLLTWTSPCEDWSLTSLKEKLIKIGAKVVSHGRYVAFQMAEVAIPRQMFQEILRPIAELRPQPPPAPRETPDGHAFKGDRWEKCVKMPTKTATSAPRPLFGLRKVTVLSESRFCLAGRPERREYSR
jgi:hypothetical protein